MALDVHQATLVVSVRDEQGSNVMRATVATGLRRSSGWCVAWMPAVHAQRMDVLQELRPKAKPTMITEARRQSGWMITNSASCKIREMPQALDTSPRVAAVHVELYRAAGEAKRAEIMADLSDALRALAAAGVRQRHPEYDEEQIQQEVLAVFYGGRKPA